MDNKRLFLLDAYALIFRAYYALIKMPRMTSTGFNSSAVFGFVNTLMAFTAIDDDDLVGFFTMRRPTESHDELRFGFVVIDPDKRGKGYGKSMLQLGVKFAKEIYGAKKVSLGVFENNESAYFCYKAVGFHDVVLEKTEKYVVHGKEWKCLELEMNL